MGRTIIVGSGGRLGAALQREWTKAGEEVVGFNHSQLDLGNVAEMRRILGALEFDVLVNCAALTNVDYCETHEAEAYQLNADAVRVLAEISSEKGARCIHISTDYVFDGEQRRPYSEADPANPISVYGASKKAGEVALLAVDENHLNVRVSWVFGPDRPSFVDQVLQRAREHDTAQAIADKWAVPTYTLDVAGLLYPFLHEVQAGGIVHLCNQGECTWQEYGQFTLDRAAALGIPLKARTVEPLKMADLNAFVAKRPPYTVMSTALLTRLTSQQPRSWQDAVNSFLEEKYAGAALSR